MDGRFLESWPGAYFSLLAHHNGLHWGELEFVQTPLGGRLIGKEQKLLRKCSGLRNSYNLFFSTIFGRTEVRDVDIVGFFLMLLLGSRALVLLRLTQHV